MRIGLTYDLQTDPHDERQAEFDPPRTIEAICQALETLGHSVVRLGNAHELLKDLERLTGIELVFNVAEGTHGRCREAWVPTLLELYGVPFVGSDALALSLGLDKVVSKQLAVASSVPTPRWVSLQHPDDWPSSVSLRFPVIVKPRAQGSGIGINAGAVVHDERALRQRARGLFERWPEPLLIEEFIAAGELTVLLIGNDPPTAFPVIQRSVDRATRLSCHITSSSEAECETPLELTPVLERETQQMAVTMFNTLGCADMARVDLRVDDQQRPWFLEINPLPSFDPDGTFGLLADSLGLRYVDLIGRVVDAATSRHTKYEIRDTK